MVIFSRERQSVPPNHAPNGGIALLFQSPRLVAAVAESLGGDGYSA